MSIIEKAVEKDRDGKPIEDETGTSVAESLEARTVDDVPVPDESPLEDETGAEAGFESGGAPLIKGSRAVELDFDHLEQAGILTPRKVRSAIAEELRIIKRPLLVNAFGQGGPAVEHGNLIMVASALPGEGKTFTATNLAMSIAMELDRTVLLVDADVAKPSITRLLGIDADIGLVDVLSDAGVELADAMIRTDVPKLTLLPAGSHIHNSTELLASDAMRNLAGELAERYSDRVVIFDSPPLMAASQASVLARLVGQVVMVVEADRTPQHLVQEALAQLETNELIGMILNKSGQKVGTDYYGYGYYGS